MELTSLVDRRSTRLGIDYIRSSLGIHLPIYYLEGSAWLRNSIICLKSVETIHTYKSYHPELKSPVTQRRFKNILYISTPQLIVDLDTAI